MAEIALAPVHPLPTPKKDRTAAERQRRYRNKQKQTGGVTPPVTPSATVTPVTVTAPVTRDGVTAGVDVAAYAAAVTLAGMAALFSVREWPCS